ncbi:MAG: HEAT repeat domain-containing protein [Nitrospirota bacterium]|nr:HEAT repeat domain-containing protein [Nitrospirota bacterium]
MPLSIQSLALQSFPYATIILSLWIWMGFPAILSAAPLTDTRSQIVPLEQVQHVFVETLALTERGVQEFPTLQQVVSDRLAQAGFIPVHKVTAPHDIIVRVKCEERKTWTGPSQHRKGGHPLSEASRLWKGPTCHISFRYQGKPAHWSWEVRTSFEDTRQAAKTAGATNAGLYALQELQAQLTQDEFPLYLAAEWGQTDRLIHLFQQASDQLDRRRLILQLLGPLNSPAALSTIEEATKNPELAMTAITALGDQGEVAIPTLVNILNTSKSPEHQLTALKGLGEIAKHSVIPTLYDVFIQQLQSQDPRMQTIAVRGLGRLGDLRAKTTIEALNLQAWSNPSTDEDIQALREALNWSLFQLDPASHF